MMAITRRDGKGLTDLMHGEAPPAFSVVDLLDAAVERFPTREALILPARDRAFAAAPDGCANFRQLSEMVGRLASTFHMRGIGKGDRVIVLVPMSLELYLTVLALAKLAATAIFVDPRMGLREMARCCAAAGPKAFVGTARAHVLRLFSRGLRQVTLNYVAGDGWVPGTEHIRALLRQDAPPVEIQRPADDVPVLVTFTTGSTGAPKAMGRTHRFLWTQHRALVESIPAFPDDVDLCALPVFVLHNMALGIPTVLPALDARGRAVPAAAVRQVQEHKVTTLRASPAFCEEVAEYCHTHSISLASVRAVLTGGAPVPPGLVRSLRSLLPNGEVHIVYGSTEAEPIAMICGQTVVSETGALTSAGWGNCVGRPVDSIRVQVLPLSRAGSIPPPGSQQSDAGVSGAAGEIIVAGDHVNKTYFEDPEAVARTKLVDGSGTVWHRTGDVGYFDAQGRLWLVGRVGTSVRRGTRELHPLEVEPIVGTLNFVRRCALLGIEDSALGQKAVIVVEPRDFRVVQGRNAAREHARLVRDLLAARGITVDDVVFTKAIPVDKRHNAKTDYDALRAGYRPASRLRSLK